MFGEFIKKKRLKHDLSLRKFCKIIGEDPSNWSKVERGLLLPPKEDDKLKTIAKALQIKTDSDEWNKLKDLAEISSGNIPPYIKSNKELLEFLPGFFRTLNNVKPTKKELEELLEALKKGE